MLQFAANLSTMFQEMELKKRFDEAKKHGFKYVEMQFPYDEPPDSLAAANSGLQCVLINSYCGAEEMGLASVPGKEVKFLHELHRITPYYNSLGVQCVHIMAGMCQPEFSFDEQLLTYKQNLGSAISYLENQDIVGVIEPICSSVKGNYFLSSFDTAVEVIKEVDSEHLKLLLDIYHLHKITGDVKKNLEIYYPYAAHIQISQEPGRHEPFYPGGEIDYQYVLDFLVEKKYAKPIGLEYFPSGPTAETLKWMKNYM